MRRFLQFSLAALLLAGAFALTANAVRSSTGQPVPTETAVLTGTLNDGETIPLPQYADGTTAIESDCHWSVGIQELYVPSGAAVVTCTATARVARLRTDGYLPYNCAISYMIIATRQALGATPTAPWSWGSIKQAFGR